MAERIDSGTPQVLFPHSGTGVGGSVVSTALMAHELKRQGLAVPIIVRPAPGDASELDEEYELETHYLGMRQSTVSRLRRTERLSRKVQALPAGANIMLRAARVLPDLQPDIIHVNDDQGMLVWGLLGKVLGIPVVWHVRRMRGSFLDTVRSRLADAVVYVSEAAAARLDAQSHNWSVEAIIYNGFDFSALSPLPEEEQAAIRAALGVPRDAPLVGFIARLTSVKRPGDFVAAGLRTLKHVPSTHFALVGGDPTLGVRTERLSAVVGTAGAADHFHFLGYRSDATRILGAFDVLLVASEEEGFGRVVVEAMARGVPVIASAVGGIKEIIDEPGDNGVLVPVGDVEAFSRMTAILLEDSELRETIAGEARRSARERFDITSVTKEIVEKVYDPLLRRRRLPSTR